MPYITAKEEREQNRRVRELEAKVVLLQSKVDAFFSGDIPENASLDHMVLAQAGRERIRAKAKRAVLLSGNKPD